MTDSGGLTTTKAFTVTVVTAFNQWANTYGLTGTNSGPTASYTNDGNANLLKFAFGVTPTIPGMSVIQVTNGTVASHGAGTVYTTSNGNFALFGRLDNYASAD